MPQFVFYVLIFVNNSAPLLHCPFEIYGIFLVVKRRHVSNHAFVPADDEASVVGEVVVEEFEHFVLKVVIEVYEDIAA
jgi:hypothetical protein